MIVVLKIFFFWAIWIEGGYLVRGVLIIATEIVKYHSDTEETPFKVGRSISTKKLGNTREMSKERWKIERTNVRMDSFRSIRTRFDT